ncbi:MAG: hypothetical protein SFU86_17615 [Pirellulaceae bacterium]|nr:hypothetical protein [Pirellulaceae bacterium]
MLFTLEALQAKHGDSLILHYGHKKAPRFIVIDGGPATVFRKWLGPRLEELRAKWGKVSTSGVDKVLPIDLLMVSHIDDDHLNGVLALFEKLEEDGTKPYEIATLWHNAFDDILGNDDDELRKAISSELKTATASGTLVDFVKAIDKEQGKDNSLDRERMAVAANVPQGQRLRNLAKTAKAQVNCLTLADARKAKSVKLVAAAKGGSKFYDFNDGLKFCIIGPSADRLAALQKEWAKAVRAAAKKKQKAKALAAAYLDESAFNLSSIVIVAELGGKRMLLTGDARGDYILEGLIASKLLKKGGAVHFDLLKVMHHGSDRNVEEAFFRQVTADHYVVSADGKHNNPDMPTLQWIANARGQDDYLIHLTNRDGDNELGKKLTDLLATPKFKHLKKRVRFRDDDAKGMKIDLLEGVKY